MFDVTVDVGEIKFQCNAYKKTSLRGSKNPSKTPISSLSMENIIIFFKVKIIIII